MNLLSALFSLIFNRSAYTRKTVSYEAQEKIGQDWKNIDLLLAGKSPSQLRQALITADKTLDNALRDLVLGESMGERLKNAKNRYDPVTYNKLWKAHKIRNNLVHEAGYEPPYHMLIEAVEDLRRGVQKLGVTI